MTRLPDRSPPRLTMVQLEGDGHGREINPHENACEIVNKHFMASLPSPDDRAKGIASAVSALVWLAYLDSSKRVKATYDL